MVEMASLSGPEKAAIFLIAMGEKFTSQIFNKLDDRQIKKLSRAMSRVQDIPAETVQQVLNVFLEALGKPLDSSGSRGTPLSSGSSPRPWPGIGPEPSWKTSKRT